MQPPLGHDPTFQPASRLWDYDLIAREGEYYNTSQVCVLASALRMSAALQSLLYLPESWVVIQRH